MDEDKPVLQLADVIELLDETIEDFKNSPGGESINFHKYLLPLPYIFIDRYRIKKALFALIQNLTGVTKPGGKIKVKTEKENQLIKISIKSSNLSNFKYPELSTLRKIIKQHNGYLNINIREDSVTFCIYLPLP